MTLPKKLLENAKTPGEQWDDVLAALTAAGIAVLKAATYDGFDRRGRVHLLALDDVSMRYRFIPGLDTTAFAPFPGESVFCGRPSLAALWSFRLERSRREESRIGLPNCPECVRVIGRFTELPVNNLKAVARQVRTHTTATRQRVAA